MARDPSIAIKGRGALDNPTSRYSQYQTIAFDDGWQADESDDPKFRTTLYKDRCKKALSWNRSPDVPFDRSVNPYRGCEHGCIYCYARPSHNYLDLSAGLDFETKLFCKLDIKDALEADITHHNYSCAPIAIGVNTDAYQPVEKKLRLTRAVLTLLSDYSHPCTVVTKSALIERDLDLLTSMAGRQLVSVAISITTLDASLARLLEPRAMSPKRRLAAIQRLSDAGVPVTLMVAPLIPVLTDAELETILKQAREAGARSAMYVLLRLPGDVSALFQNWLNCHFPLKAKHIMAQIRECREGRVTDSRFGRRMTGQGIFAQLLRQRFNRTADRLGYEDAAPLNTSLFQSPARTQLNLF